MLPRNDKEKLDELKIKMSDYIHDMGGYNKVYVNMNLNAETLKKTIRLSQKSRKVSREMLAKFVIGAKLSLDQANELFALHSYELNSKTTLIDAVVVHCINNKDDINGFLDVCEQVHLDVKIIT